MDKIEFQDENGCSDTHQRESNPPTESESKPKMTSMVQTAKKTSPFISRAGTPESFQDDWDTNAFRDQSRTPAREGTQLTPEHLPKRSDMGSDTPETEIYQEPGRRFHGRVEISPEKLEITITRDKSELIAYQNVIDDKLTVNVTKCDKWTQKQDKSKIRCGRLRQHPDATPMEKITKECFTAMTWKGKRIVTSEYRAERPLNFSNVPIPRNFTFRYKQLDKYIAELFHEGLYEPCIKLGFIGDSTMIKIRTWLQCWDQSHNCTEGVVRFSDVD
ncbi:MAG: hypothetical protein GY696_04265, partial [Gammaproteobacteria bacterium]|nr:hypothetical protein [Gammaproteobacteria bacterium]